MAFGPGGTVRPGPDAAGVSSVGGRFARVSDGAGAAVGENGNVNIVNELVSKRISEGDKGYMVTWLHVYKVRCAKWSMS